MCNGIYDLIFNGWLFRESVQAPGMELLASCLARPPDQSILFNIRYGLAYHFVQIMSPVHLGDHI